MELHSDYYELKLYKQEIFKTHITPDSLYEQLPLTIKSFEFSPNQNLISFCKSCEIQVSKLEAKDKVEDKLKICYAKYIQTAPELRFAFELQKNNAIYHIKEVSVYIYNSKIPLNIDKNYFNHKQDEKEKLFIDITKTRQTQTIQLNQAHAAKDGGLALNLRFFPAGFWNGSFEKTKVLLHINFIFTNNQTIQSEPFMIEI
ncbi:hypothetical protein PW52_01475 [Tamlana sedimentorum]|uniref:Uncharacterized protein n=1 Tax=Neotamlana sedimentorum TaxID=1435349 RepID=A0A0D7WEM3_9FLAO|nr:hypothetical protein [Tamlana sedimentorum]KJD37153.1 hypothetical protein PW52_01475 [Tamlana sedimentorum]